MSSDKTDIWVYAHWVGMKAPECIGLLSAHQAKGRKAFSFEYNTEWLKSKKQFILDPDINWFSGTQFPNNKDNFGIFTDTMPDTWGRTLLKKRAALTAKSQGKPPPTLYDIDFLLGVFDESRMGALRFKLYQDGPFLDNNSQTPTPHWINIKDLQHASAIIESNDDKKDLKKWMALIIAPGSSLGGARPKANILDANNHPWIAKFPSKNDDIDKGAWEFLVYKLALEAGVEMAESKIQRISGDYHTFFTKRFDRHNGERIHFSSAMTMTGNNEETIKDNPPSYLDLADFIQTYGINIKHNLHQLWRRIVFNIAVSNTDDHLRNHGFLLHNNAWILSPAYDINPSVEKESLALNIDLNESSLNFELAKSVGQYFQLNNEEMNSIISEVKKSVSGWKKLAKSIGISRSEQELMFNAFRY